MTEQNCILTPLQNSECVPTNVTPEGITDRTFLQDMSELEHMFTQTPYFQELKKKFQNRVQPINDIEDYVFGSWGTPQEYHLGHLPEYEQDYPHHEIYKYWESFDLSNIFLQYLDRDAKYMYRKDGKLSLFGQMAVRNFDRIPRNPKCNEVDVEPAFEELKGELILFSDLLKNLFRSQMMYQKGKRGVTQKLIYQLRLMSMFMLGSSLGSAMILAKDNHTEQDLVIACAHYALNRDGGYLLDLFDL